MVKTHSQFVCQQCGYSQVVLIAGEPGIGKSTLLLQLADKIGNALYVSGEESAGQIKVRADRLGVKSKTLKFLEETDVEQIIESIDNQFLVVVDSIQTMTTDDLSESTTTRNWL